MITAPIELEIPLVSINSFFLRSLVEGNICVHECHYLYYDTVTGVV